MGGRETVPSSTGLKPLPYTKREYATLDFEERIYQGKRKNKEDGALPFGFLRVKRDGGATANGKTKEDAAALKKRAFRRAVR